MKLRAVGVVFNVDGKHYIKMLNGETVQVSVGQSLKLTLDDVDIHNWSADPEVMGLMPLGEVEKGNPIPIPPKFASVEEADEWLDSHPVRT
jgi:hypothetical protein